MNGVGGKLVFGHASRAGVRAINQNIAVNSERFILAATREHIEIVVQRSEVVASDRSARADVQIIQSGADSSTTMATLWPFRRYFPLRF